MRATVMYAAGDIRIEEVPDSVVKLPTDALVKITAAAICGSDPWPYESRKPEDGPVRMGHEFIGVVEDTDRDVSTVKRGDLVLCPFAISDGICEFCRDGLQTSCLHAEASFWDEQPEGAKAEAVRVPLADGTLVKLPAAPDPALVPSLLTLADVLGTGHHAAVIAGTGPGTRVTVIGDGAVGLLSVLSARRLGAEQVILMGRHPGRTSLGQAFSATDIVAARGPEGIAAVRELAGGHGTHVVIEAVGTMAAYEQALGIVRPGGFISRVGVPQYDEAPIGSGLFRHNVRLGSGPAPVRAYITGLMPDILSGTIRPGQVFDTDTGLDGVPAGYQDMADRKTLKVLIRP